MKKTTGKSQKNANDSSPDLFKIEEGIPLPQKSSRSENEEWKSKAKKTALKLKSGQSFEISGKKLGTARTLFAKDDELAKSTWRIAYTNKDKSLARIWKV